MPGEIHQVDNISKYTNADRWRAGEISTVDYRDQAKESSSYVRTCQIQVN